MSIHEILAAWSGVEQLKLDKTEADEMGQAFKKLGAAHKIQLTAKQEAWADFTSAMGKIYGLRVIALRAERMAARAAKEAEMKQAAGVVQFDQYRPAN